ncbi:nucleotidyltransferase [Mycoplasmopsis hyopharyngis]|uniref:nucleotidyltransferase n=1 Tax=Mycoplasmopsis hyopharyngis TaxID=29558 RepID=UPI003873AF0B
MRIGIIAEYNPFHNGHLEQINWIKHNFPNSEIIVLLTDQFTQRGDLNILSFEQRKKILANYDIKEVYKMTFEQSVQAAHIYANNAVCILNEKNIDKLVFGSETCDIQSMIQNAKTLKNKERDFFLTVKSTLKQGKISYPQAVNVVLKQWNLKQFTSPNDILGYEYVKAIVNNDFNIEPIAMKRNVDYFSLQSQGNIASGTLIRQMLLNNEDVSKFTPIKSFSKFKQLSDYYQEYQKIMFKIDKEKLLTIPLISEGIENLLLKHINISTFEEYIDQCTSKRYTSSRIKRIMAWILYKFSKIKKFI